MIILETAEAVASEVAQRVSADLRSGAHTLVLAGGTTFRHAYEQLAVSDVEWGRVTVLFGDERCVAPDDPESNFRMARESLLARVWPAAVCRMPAELGPDEGATAYEALMRHLPLDVLLLGVGPDGHIASLFPGHSVLDSTSLVAGVYDAPKPPPQRVTLTLAALRGARRTYIAATGEDKADAVARAQAGEVPAGLLPAAEWIIDRAAAARVTAGTR